MFQIEQVTKLCSKTTLSEPWDPYDIPDNSTYEDQYYIGGPGDQIIVQEWSDRKRARKRKHKSICLLKLFLDLQNINFVSTVPLLTLLLESMYRNYYLCSLFNHEISDSRL